MKKRGIFIFGLLYALFFAIPFPMLLYYNIKNDSVTNLRDTDPWFALGIVAASLVLWIVLLVGYFRKWVINIFIAKRNIAHIKVTGVHREAKILAATKVSKPDAEYDTYELSLLFKNLAGAEIVQKTSIVDGKPYERRFEPGKRVDLLIDKEINMSPTSFLQVQKLL